MRINAFRPPLQIVRNAHHGMFQICGLILFAALIAGCVPTLPTLPTTVVGTWDKEGATEQETKQAEWECAQQVSSLRVPFNDRSEYYRLCMGAKGWKEKGGN